MLEPKDLLIRHQDPKDGKRLVISLTKEGIALHRKVAAERRQFFRTLMADIPTPDRPVIEDAMVAMAKTLGETHPD
ncbi:MAG: hypothetical protein WA957_12340 [Alteraurantiacibacter sp.]